MINIPSINGQISQTNSSDKKGNVWYTKNINFDEEGYIKNSARTVQLYDEAAGTADSADFENAVSIARFGDGDYLLGTSGDVFNLRFDEDSISVSENTGTNNPSMTTRSHGVIWQGLYHASTDTAVNSRPLGISSSQTWTQRITSLTTGVRHYLEVFVNRNTLTVSNKNVLKQYDTSYSGTIDLTIPSDFEIIGQAYNNNLVGVITRLSSSTEGQNTEAFFFTWDGATTSANGGFGIGADSGIAICAYKSSFAILTKNGQLLYFNGGGFEELASFPFYFTDNIYGDILNQRGRGDLMIANGDTILINLALDLESFGRRSESQLVNAPSGNWCYDPKIGLYHKRSASISQAYAFTVLDADVNTTTDILTVQGGTVPQTGSIARYTRASTVIGGLSLNQDYYAIKVTSTTFKLATSKSNALSGVSIDLTSAGTGGSNGFWMYDMIDYGQTYTNEAGSIEYINESDMLNKDVIFGTDTYNSTLTLNNNISIAVPELESRAYLVTPRIFSSEVTDNIQKIFIKHRILKPGDSIVVKARNRLVVGLPVSSPQSLVGDEADWANNRTFSTLSNLSDAKTFFDAGGELELEIVAGVGGGQLVKIENIWLNGSTYNVSVSEDVIGAAVGTSSYFIIDHWREIKTIDSSSPTNINGYAEVPIGLKGSWVQYKIELRGVDVTIEDLQIINNVDKKAV